MDLYDIPLGSVRMAYNVEDDIMSLYLHTYDPDPSKEWNFKTEWIVGGILGGPIRPTLGHLQSLIDMAKRKFEND